MPSEALNQVSLQHSESRATSVVQAGKPNQIKFLWEKLAGNVTLGLGIAALWELTHYFAGITRDGELYAMQALSRLQPYLSHDLYLANSSQDSFTLFTPLYALAIRVLGLPTACTVLLFACKILYFGAAWRLVRRWSSDRIAWISVGLLVCVACNYGPFGIFESSSDYLTARSLGEALVVIALTARYSNQLLAAVFILAALVIHPLMALPGLLVFLFVSIPMRLALAAATVGVAGTGLLALGCALGFVSNRFFVIVDPAWLYVIQERSQFLFLKYWKLSDWQMHLRIFATLALIYTSMPNEQVRKLCAAVALVAVSGLSVAWIGGSIGPVAIILQGQAWRWTWVASLFAVMLVAPAAWQLWQRDRCGRLSAVLLVLGWTYPVVNGAWVVTSALALLYLGTRIPEDRDRYMRWAAYVLLTIAGAWSAQAVLFPEPSAAQDPLFGDRLMTWMRDAFCVRTFSTSLFALLVVAVTRHRSVPWALGPICASLVIYAAPVAILSRSGFEAVRERPQFADWRSRIPASGAVLLLPGHYSSAFEWITLERPGYLSLNQEAGVVFSAATAAEVRRRSDALKPVMSPNWKLLSQNEAVARREKPIDTTRPLTAESLKQICRDPVLGFVVALEAVGFNPLRSTSTGRWKDWNLYDCQLVRSTEPPTSKRLTPLEVLLSESG